MKNEKEPLADLTWTGEISRRDLLRSLIAAGVIGAVSNNFIPAESAASDSSVKHILNGVIDLHIHTSPDVRKRRLTDIELAAEARRVGARAIVIKSHVVPTMDRAWIAEQVVPGIKVFGGITLNPDIGGLNPIAVDTAIKMGAKVVWLPTSWSAHERRLQGKNDGLEVLTPDGRVIPQLIKILQLVAKNDLILGTGHLGFNEILTVVDKAKEIGVKKIVINHPEWWSVNLSLQEQRQLAPYGVYFERCYASRAPGQEHYQKNFKKNIEAIEEIGFETTIISTDGGQMENPMWSEALSEYYEYMITAGIPQEVLNKMTKIYPAQLLNI